MLNELKSRFESKSATVGVIGLGYVGLPLAMEFVRKGFPVVGFDTDEKKVDMLRQGKTYIKHILPQTINEVINTGRFRITGDCREARESDAIIICVPTPLTKNREPDMSYIISTCNMIYPHMRKGQMIVLESTTYPGTCEEVVKPILLKSGLKLNEEFYLAYSPEREDPNNPHFTTTKIPKIVGCGHPDGLAAVKALYDQVVVETISVSSTKVAEASKLLENIFRSVNIALVNELKIVFNEMGIDVWEVINAAATKPFGFMPFYPGPGLGGHCIPVDPFYLTWKSREYDMTTKFIELAGEINTNMPRYVVQRVKTALNRRKKAVNGSRLLLLGIAYKKNVDDIRESPGLKLISLLEDQGAAVDYHDLYVPVIPQGRSCGRLAGRESVSLDEIEKYDCILVVTDHSNVDYQSIAQRADCIVDTRNVVPDGENVVKA